MPGTLKWLPETKSTRTVSVRAWESKSVPETNHGALIPSAVSKSFSVIFQPPEVRKGLRVHPLRFQQRHF